MPILIDTSRMTILERDALTAAALRENPEAPAGAEGLLQSNLDAVLRAAVDSYVAENLPSLRATALDFLTIPAAARVELLGHLAELKKASTPAAPEMGGEADQTGGG
jgi:hypothetical protein